MSSPINGSMRARSRRPEIRFGRHDRDHVDRAVERGIPGGLAERGNRVPTPSSANAVGDAGAGHLELTVLVRAGMAPEEVAVEAHRHVVLVELHPVVPQAVAYGRHPPRLSARWAPTIR